MGENAGARTQLVRRRGEARIRWCRSSGTSEVVEGMIVRPVVVRPWVEADILAAMFNSRALLGQILFDLTA